MWVEDVKKTCPCIGCKWEIPDGYNIPEQCAKCKKYDDYCQRLKLAEQAEKEGE